MNRKGLKVLLSIPKSFYVSAKLFSFKEAFKLPCLVVYNCRLKELDGKISVQTQLTKFCFIFGFGRVSVFDEKSDRAVLDVRGTIVLKDEANFGAGSRLSVGKNAVLTIGGNFSNTAKGTIICADSISIGDKVLTSWNTCIMDTDFHRSFNVLTGQENTSHNPIRIGDGVWIGMGVSVLKGSFIPDGCIVGANSLVNKKFYENNALIAGNHGTVKAKDVSIKR